MNLPPLVAVLLASALLILAFPSFNQPWCAWIALVPWLVLLRTPRKVSDTSQSGKSVRHFLRGGRRAFWWSYLIGFLFFLGSIWWLIHVTVIGWLVLCAFLALYFGLFGLCVAILEPRTSNLERLALAPSMWVALEYARSHVLSGFGWSLLAYSQTPWTPLIQFADITGAWGVSFLIVLVNIALATLLGSGATPRERWVAPVAACACVAVALGYGAWRIPQVVGPASVRVAVVQGNIAQEEKWDAAFQERILARYDALTRAIAATSPDLIVWPETSVPALFDQDDALTQQVAGLARTLGRPLLVGAPALSASIGTRALTNLTNSAFLITGSGAIGARYDKLHLVPFGEFIPFDVQMPWLRHFLPPIGDFVPGHSYTVFQLRSRVQGQGSREDLSPSPFTLHPAPISFSVLICFEDIFPELVRHFVQRGARILLVITNDAWFGPTGAAYQHAQASTFRAVELRVPVARAANTGWSGCIDPAGRVIGSVRSDGGTELFVAGTQTCELPLGVANSPYRRWGDWFVLLCLSGVIGWWGCRIRRIIRD